MWLGGLWYVLLFCFEVCCIRVGGLRCGRLGRSGAYADGFLVCVD